MTLIEKVQEGITCVKSQRWEVLVIVKKMAGVRLEYKSRFSSNCEWDFFARLRGMKFIL